MPKLLYFRNEHDEDAIMSSLARIASEHGYTNMAGPKPGQGNVAELLAAIADGEVALVLLPDEHLSLAVDFLRQAAREQSADLPLSNALSDIASSLARPGVLDGD